MGFPPARFILFFAAIGSVAAAGVLFLGTSSKQDVVPGRRDGTSIVGSAGPSRDHREVPTPGIEVGVHGAAGEVNEKDSAPAGDPSPFLVAEEGTPQERALRPGAQAPDPGADSIGSEPSTTGSAGTGEDPGDAVGEAPELNSETEEDPSNVSAGTVPVLNPEEYSALLATAYSLNEAFFDLSSEEEENHGQVLRRVRFPVDEPTFPEPSSRRSAPEETPGAEEPVPDQPRLGVSSTSSISLGGVTSFLPLQDHVMEVSEDGAGRRLQFPGNPLAFPEVPLAFDQFVKVEQWGLLEGYLDSSGNISLNLTVRLTDPGSVLDIPFELTTGEVIGRTTSQTGVFLRGQPLDPASGNFELVGIQNVPAGLQSALESEAVIIRVVGQLTSLEAP